MIRHLAVFATVLFAIPAAVHAQSVSLAEPTMPAIVSAGSLARIHHGLAAAPAATDARFVRAAMEPAIRLQQPSVAEWQKEFEHTTALRRKSNTVMKLGLVLAGVGALSAAATPNAKGTMAVAMATPGLGIATWGYLARRKGDKELKRLEGTRPAGAKSPRTKGQTQ